MGCKKLCDGSHSSQVFGFGHGDVAMSGQADGGRCGGLWAACRWTPRVSVHDTRQGGLGPRPGPPVPSTNGTAKPMRQRGLAGLVMGGPTTGKRHLKNNRLECLFRQTRCDHDGVDLVATPSAQRRRGAPTAPHTRGSGSESSLTRRPSTCPRNFRRGSGTSYRVEYPGSVSRVPRGAELHNASARSPVP
jgi:hypothetical protein